jgi:hypothetical protein
MSIEQYRAEIDRIKSSHEYISLASKHRGDLDQKNFDKFRLRIKGLEAKMAALNPATAGKKGPAVPTGPIRHPVNPAIARIAREPASDAKNKEKIVINQTKLIINREKHDELVRSNELDLFINGPTETDNVDVLDDILFDDEPMPDF